MTPKNRKNPPGTADGDVGTPYGTLPPPPEGCSWDVSQQGNPRPYEWAYLHGKNSGFHSWFMWVTGPLAGEQGCRAGYPGGDGWVFASIEEAIAVLMAKMRLGVTK